VRTENPVAAIASSDEFDRRLVDAILDLIRRSRSALAVLSVSIDRGIGDFEVVSVASAVMSARAHIVGSTLSANGDVVRQGGNGFLSQQVERWHFA
jgi:hypothetical protein